MKSPILKYFAIAIMTFLAGLWSGQVIFKNTEQLTPDAIPNPISNTHSDLEKDQQLRDLQEALTLANAELEILRKKLEARSDTSDTAHLPVATTRFPGLEQKINEVPEFMLKSQLSYFFDEQSIENLQDPRQFAHRALEVALNNEDISEELTSASIEFSLSPVTGSRLLGAGAEVQQYDRVFAHIKAQGDTDAVPPDVMVKWQKADTGEVLMFRNQRFNNNDELYVSHKPTGGWQPGNYRVSVYNMDDHVTPVSSNSYSIDSVLTQEDGGKGPNEKVIEDLLLSGKATRKQ